MEIIPAIDIRGGRCVRLVQGDYDRETVFADDPAAAALRWRDAGATRLHGGDLVRQVAEMGVTRVIYTDTVRDGTLTEPNFAALEVIVSYIRISATKLKIIYAGGVSSIDHLRRLAGTGVEGAIVGRALYTGDIDLSKALATIEGAAGWQ